MKLNLKDMEINELKAASDNGDANASYRLGILYFKGDGVPRDKQIAIKYFEKAADGGNLQSMLALISRYTIDRDIEKNWNAAEKCLDRAVELDERRVEILFPKLLRGRRIFKRAYDLEIEGKIADAIDMYLAAANCEYASAYFKLGEMIQNDTASFEWHSRAMSAGVSESILRLENCYRTGKGTKKDIQTADFLAKLYQEKVK